jgi:hypothetical protein
MVCNRLFPKRDIIIIIEKRREDSFHDKPVHTKKIYKGG